MFFRGRTAVHELAGHQCMESFLVRSIVGQCGVPAGSGSRNCTEILQASQGSLALKVHSSLGMWGC